jgi:nanoRNase/pAp phosphatase (c-di-AMP/oligoRNAs hydrolase)
MNRISKFIGISSIFFVIFISTNEYYLKYTFSEYFPSQYPVYVYSKSYKSNQTSLNTDCDFLNLCGNYQDNKLTVLLQSTNNNILDISYIGTYIKLPFP